MDCFIFGKPAKNDCRLEPALFHIAILWKCFFFVLDLFLLPWVIFMNLLCFVLDIWGSSVVMVGFCNIFDDSFSSNSIPLSEWQYIHFYLTTI